MIDYLRIVDAEKRIIVALQILYATQPNKYVNRSIADMLC
jgi:hypothetical protein